MAVTDNNKSQQALKYKFSANDGRIVLTYVVYVKREGCLEGGWVWGECDICVCIYIYVCLIYISKHPIACVVNWSHRPSQVTHEVQFC